MGRRKRGSKHEKRHELSAAPPHPASLEPQTGPTSNTMKRRTQLLAECIKKYPYVLASKLADKQDAGWSLGRLYIVGVLTRQERDAGYRLHVAINRYNRLLKKYPSYTASNYGRALQDRNTGQGEDLSNDALQAFARAQRERDRLMDTLKLCGKPVMDAVLDALDDKEVDIGLLAIGLNSLLRS